MGPLQWSNETSFSRQRASVRLPLLHTKKRTPTRGLKWEACLTHPSEPKLNPHEKSLYSFRLSLSTE